MAANIYQAVKQAMQDLIAPQLESLKGDIGALRAEVSGEIGTLRTEMSGEIRAVRGEIGTLRAEMNGEIRALRGEVSGEIGALRAEMRGNHATLGAEIRRIDEKLTWALDLRDRIAAIETKLAGAAERT